MPDVATKGVTRKLLSGSGPITVIVAGLESPAANLNREGPENPKSDTT